MRRNVSGQIVTAHLINRTDGTDVTTGSVSVFVTGDGGTQTSGSGTVTHEGNGDWSYAPTQAETNFSQVVFTFVHSSAITTKEERYPVDYDSAGRVTANSVTGNVAGNLSGSVGSVTGNVGGNVVGSVGSVVGNVGGNVVGSVASVVDKTGYSLATAPLDAAGTRSALGLAAANLDTQLSAINSKTTNLPSDPADASDIAAAFSTVNGTLSTIAGYVDTEVAAVKAVTDKLDTAMELDGSVYRFTVNALEQAPVGGGGSSTDWTTDERTAIRTILGIPASGTTPDVPSAGALKVIDDFLDTEVAAIKAKTDNLPSDPASAATLASSFSTINGTLATISGYIDTEVAAIKAKTDTIPTWPTNFASLAITGGGAVTAGTVSDKTGYSLAANQDVRNVTGSVTGAVGSVTAGVTLADGAITAAKIAAAAITAAKFAANAIDANALATDAVAEITAAIEAEILNDATGGAVVTTIANAVAAYFDSASLDIPPQVIATAVRNALATELARIDVAVSTRLASGSYSAPPAASAVATAVRTELSTELARIDVATSTRLASASYSAPPSASAIATQVITSMGTGTFLTAIPWNAAWDTEVQSECADALAAYDPPTKAELDAAIAGIPGGGGGGGGATVTNGTARRNLSNTAPLHFTFPVANLNNAAFTTKQVLIGESTTPRNVEGAISFLYSENGLNWYALAYDADDRPSSPMIAQYRFSDGTNEVAYKVDFYNSLSQANVLPGRDRGLPQSGRSRIVVSQGELITIARQVVDGNGNPMNLAGRTLQFIIQDARGVDIAVIPHSSITVSGTNNDSYSFTMTAECSARAGNFSYWLNDVGASKAELVTGDWIVKPRPLADA